MMDKQNQIEELENVWLLISFCNQENTYSSSALVNIATGYMLPMNATPGHHGFTGIAFDEKYIYLLSQGETSGIQIYEKNTFKLILTQTLDELGDAHSLVVYSGFLYAVSTGTDQVQKYYYNEKQNRVEFKEVVWTVENSSGKSNTHHINSLLLYKNKFYVTGFGQKKDEMKTSARDGYIYSITDKKYLFTGIFHPHSLINFDSTLYFCESMRHEIKTLNGTLIKRKKGYLRGLAVNEKYVIFGESMKRVKSRSMNKKVKVDSDSYDTGTCSVYIYNKKTLKCLKIIDFSQSYSEIYDIQILPSRDLNFEKITENIISGMNHLYKVSLNKESEIKLLTKRMEKLNLKVAKFKLKADKYDMLANLELKKLWAAFIRRIISKMKIR